MYKKVHSGSCATLGHELSRILNLPWNEVVKLVDTTPHQPADRSHSAEPVRPCDRPAVLPGLCDDYVEQGEPTHRKNTASRSRALNPTLRGHSTHGGPSSTLDRPALRPQHWVYPASTSWPVGFSWSSCMAQEVTLECLLSTGTVALCTFLYIAYMQRQFLVPLSYDRGVLLHCWPI